MNSWLLCFVLGLHFESTWISESCSAVREVGFSKFWMSSSSPSPEEQGQMASGCAGEVWVGDRGMFYP